MVKEILVLGGGYGSLRCVLTLQKYLKDEEVCVTLVSKHDYHYATTLLHKVASGTYSSRKARVYYRKIIKRKNFKFIKDKIEKIDLQNKIVYGKYACYGYDYLVIGLGFEVNSFGVKGVKEHALKIKTLNKAIEIRTHIEDKFKNFKLTSDKYDLSFVVCGSGFTGVEFASEFANRVVSLCEISGIDKNLVKIYLVGRDERILPMFSKKMSQKAKEKIENLNIQIVKANVIECQKDGVLVENEDGKTDKIYANTTLWCAGVKGSAVIEHSGLSSENSRVGVDEFLKVTNFENVFGVGDCAVATKKDLKHAPTAQLAYQMGEYVAFNLIKLLNHQNLSKPFKFEHRGTVCSIGHTDAVGMAFGLEFSGEFGAFMKNFIENKWLYSIAGFWQMLKKGQFRFRSND
ncbi:MAG: NAD(P)/FAD-dependent oxidoreductase [Campylobacter sp.]|nr:NAD(P)/FAD-dependent oxidoreductase [Campylobacter sp.]